jgi:hypothetical protein
MLTCPGPSDGPSILVNAVEEAYRGLLANPTTPLPPTCVLAAYAQVSAVLPDSIDAHALAVAAELGRRGSNDHDLLTSEIVLSARSRRYADVSRFYDRLAAIDSQPPMQAARLAIAAARQRADTAALSRILSRVSGRADASPALRSELTVLRQVSALHSAIAEARGLIRQNPKYVAAYPSLIANFGTLGTADSVAAYVRRALAQGATRASLTPAVDPLVNTMLRHAALYGSTYRWDTVIAAAMRVDSSTASASTRFLVAALIAQSAEPQIAQIDMLVSGNSWLPGSMGAAATGEAARGRAAACDRIPALTASLDLAQLRLREGGDRYAGGGVSQLVGSLANEKSRLAALQDVCGRGRSPG